MDYKEKYEKAVQAAMLVKQDTESAVTIGILEEIFPELKESEDERIRKELINGFNKLDKNAVWYNGITNGQILAWLENQGEHAKFRDSIQVGDKVTRNRDGMLVNLSQLKRVAKPAENKGEHDMGISESTKQELEDNLNEALEKETPESCHEFLDKQGDQKPQIKLVFPKFRVGDIIQHIPLEKWDTTKKITHIDEAGYYFNLSHQGDAVSGGFIGFSFENDYELVGQKPAWSEEDEEMYTATIFALAGFIGNEDVLDWLKNLKERVSREVNYTTTKEWSEEDEARFESCVKVLQTSDGYDTINAKWLKSLKERYTWKPSEEQIKAVKEAACYSSVFSEKTIDNLISLSKQLKKLREE